jgi:trans-aconitate 2-methyltransferase
MIMRGDRYVEPTPAATPCRRDRDTKRADERPRGRAMATEMLRRAPARPLVDTAEAYYDLLVSRTRELDIWATEYLHLLEGANPVLEWVKGAGLSRLPEQSR